MTPRVLDPAHLDEAAAVLGRAFQHESSALYVFPHAHRRADAFPQFAAVLIRYALRHGQVTALMAPLRAVAIWVAPGHTAPTDEALDAVGMSSFLATLSPEERDRAARLFACMAAMHARVMDEPHWYLPLLGVDPAHQGAGLGSALLTPMLAQISARGLPCYLDTFAARTVPFYQRHGFRVAQEGILPGTALPAWALRRDETTRE